MYQPEIKPELVKSLNRVKQVYKKPMAKIVNVLLEVSLGTMENEEICKLCREQGNDIECDKCHFNRKGVSHTNRNNKTK